MSTIFFTPVIVKYMEKYLYITKPRYSKYIFFQSLDPFNCITATIRVPDSSTIIVLVGVVAYRSKF